MIPIVAVAAMEWDLVLVLAACFWVSTIYCSTTTWEELLDCLATMDTDMGTTTTMATSTVVSPLPNLSIVTLQIFAYTVWAILACANYVGHIVETVLVDLQ